MPRTFISTNKQCSLKRKLSISTKIIDSYLPARTAQADMSRCFLLLVNFIHIKRLLSHYAKLVGDRRGGLVVRASAS